MNREELLQDGERLDDLQYKGLFLIQKPQGYCFTSDAVLLANFLKVKSGEQLLELCGGSAVISILAVAKNPLKHATCVELQPSLADMALRSVEYNGMSDIITVVNGDVRELKNYFPEGGADVVCCNPPYFRVGEGETCPTEEIAVARHELKLTLNQCVTAAARALKYGGRCYYVYRADRMAELIGELTAAKLAPKRIFIVSPYYGAVADTVLIEALKNGKSGAKVLCLNRPDIDLNKLKEL